MIVHGCRITIETSSSVYEYIDIYTVKNNYPKQGNGEQICGVKRELPCRLSKVYNSMAGYSFYHSQGLYFLPNIVQFFNNYYFVIVCIHIWSVTFTHQMGVPFLPDWIVMFTKFMRGTTFPIYCVFLFTQNIPISPLPPPAHMEMWSSEQ